MNEAAEFHRSYADEQLRLSPAESSMAVKLAVVVPCYDEEEVFPETSKRLLALLADDSSITSSAKKEHITAMNRRFPRRQLSWRHLPIQRFAGRLN